MNGDEASTPAERVWGAEDEISSVSARHLLADEMSSAARCLGLAFADDPLTRWLAGAEDGDDVMDESIDGFFAPAIEIGIGRGHTYVVPGQTGIDAVSVWSPPDVHMFDEATGGALAARFATANGDDAIVRLLAVSELTSGLHPSDPHFYLFLLGAAVHGRGAGGDAVAPVLARCDAQGVGAYLESSSSRNHGFYERLGFEAVWHERPEPDGPVLTGMWRDPRR